MFQTKAHTKFYKKLFVVIGIIVAILAVLGFGALALFGFLPSKFFPVLGRIKCDKNYEMMMRKENRFYFGTGSLVGNHIYLVKGTTEHEIHWQGFKIPTNPSINKVFAADFQIKQINPNSEQKTKVAFLPSTEFQGNVYSSEEFETISNCLSQNHSEFSKLFSSNEVWVGLPDILVYGKDENVFYGNNYSYEMRLVCSDNKSLRMQDVKSLEDIEIDYFTEPLVLGKFNSFGDFERLEGKIIENPIFDDSESALKAKYNPEINYKVDLQGSSKIIEKETADKFFSTEGIKNDYLQTCKNDEGKTLFDIFKQ